jgi:hypothetical protein
MIEFIKIVLQIIFLILSNKFKNDKDKKQTDAGLSAEINSAIMSRDISKLNSIIVKLRQ